MSTSRLISTTVGPNTRDTEPMTVERVQTILANLLADGRHQPGDIVEIGDDGDGAWLRVTNLEARALADNARVSA